MRSCNKHIIFVIISDDERTTAELRVNNRRVMIISPSHTFPKCSVHYVRGIIPKPPPDFEVGYVSASDISNARRNLLEQNNCLFNS